ncbi:hypothetical protein QEG73_00920 [Chitinophagaceae bacterium 26-R-25]|nr:hypothetical protein [Chitinophagaceae bacterium 26-R-25]
MTTEHLAGERGTGCLIGFWDIGQFGLWGGIGVKGRWLDEGWCWTTARWWGDNLSRIYV